MYFIPVPVINQRTACAGASAALPGTDTTRSVCWSKPVCCYSYSIASEIIHSSDMKAGPAKRRQIYNTFSNRLFSIEQSTLLEST